MTVYLKLSVARYQASKSALNTMAVNVIPSLGALNRKNIVFPLFLVPLSEDHVKSFRRQFFVLLYDLVKRIV
jgi:hypothetical protein